MYRVRRLIVRFADVWILEALSLLAMDSLVPGIRLIGSANYKAWTMPKVLDFMARTIHQYPFDKVISHKFSLKDAEEGMKQAMAGNVVRAASVID
mgnify:CR=1 FL=1